MEPTPSFRPNRRLLWIALGLNALLAAIFLAGPYLLGRWRADEGRARFARFAACLWGGEPAEDPGLGLPPGERLHFADRMFHGPPQWPERCSTALDRVRPGSALLLFPSLEQAEGLVTERVGRVADELASAAALRRDQRPSHVPLDLHGAVQRLVAALANRARVSGADASLTREAIHFEQSIGLARPTRVPLRVDRDARMRMEAHGDGLVAIAVDQRSIARVKVGAGGMTLQRVKRPGLVRGAVPSPEGRPWLAWAMPEARCAEEPDRCAGHATGVARLGRDDTSAPEPTWLAGHPEVGVEQALRVRGREPDTVVDLIARTVGGGAEVRRFVLPEPGSSDAREAGDDGSAPVVASADWALRGFGRRDTARLLPGTPARVVWTARDARGTALRARSLTAGSPIEDLARLDDAPPPWLRACTAGGNQWLVWGNGARAKVVRFGDDGADLIGDPAEVRPSEEPSVRLGCGPDRAVLAWPRAKGRGLGLLACAVRDGCRATRHLEAGARHFEVTREDEVILIAFASEPEHQIRVAAWPDGSDAPGEPRVVAPCFGEAGGLCGPPSLASRNGRILLGAREGTDLLVVETTDGGRGWRPMRGLR